MNTKYVVFDYHPYIRSYACEKETPKFVWLKDYYGNGGNRQMAKNDNVFSTWQEAHAELTRRAEASLASARLSLQRAQGMAGNVRAMKPPSEEVGLGVVP